MVINTENRVNTARLVERGDSLWHDIVLPFDIPLSKEDK